MTRAGIMAMMRPPATGGPPPVTLFEDDFESYADGSGLDAAPLWATAQGIGTGVMTIDTHTAHKSGQVVDMSTKGSQFAIWQGGAVGADDHYVEVVVFTDEMAVTGDDPADKCGGGPLLRMQAASPSSPSGYLVEWVRTPTNYSPGTYLALYRVDSGSLTLLETTTNLDGTYSKTATHTIRATIDGATITVSIDGGSDLIDYDTTSDGTKYTTGQYVGVYQIREYQVAATTAQPFFDDFEAGTL